MRSERAMNDPRGQSCFDEDLATLAEYSFRVAQSSCIACNEFHALFTYTRLAGVNNGAAPDKDFLSSLLRDVSRPRARILIAGAADAGLLALTARATIGLEPRITVADRCATPLAVCLRYAEMHRLDIATVQAELTRESIPGPFDVALAHNILFFIPPDFHPAFFRNLGASIGKGGVLVLVNRERRPKWSADGSLRFGNFAATIETALLDRDILLPEPREDFRQRLERAAHAERARAAFPVEGGPMEANLLSAGFRIEQHVEHKRRTSTVARDGHAAEKIPTHFFVATFLG